MPDDPVLSREKVEAIFGKWFGELPSPPLQEPANERERELMNWERRRRGLDPLYEDEVEEDEEEVVVEEEEEEEDDDDRQGFEYLYEAREADEHDLDLEGPDGCAHEEEEQGVYDYYAERTRTGSPTTMYRRSRPPSPIARHSEEEQAFVDDVKYIQP